MAVLVYPNCNDIVAHQPGVRKALRDTAKAGGRRAAAILAAHRHDGDARITVTYGALDAFVNLDDSRGQRAAAAIEFGRSGGARGATQGIHAITGAW